MIKKILLSILLVLACTPAWCANKYLSAALGTGSWADATGTWVTTDGGTTPTTPPAVADNVYLTVNAGARTLNIDSAAQCANFYATTFVGTLAGSSTILVRGDFNLSGAFTFSYNGAWTSGSTTSAGTWTPGGKTFLGSFTSGSTGSKTLVNPLTVSGVFYMSASCTINGSIIYANGGVESVSATSYNMLGTVELIVGGGNLKNIVKRGAGGKLTINGNVNIDGNTQSITTGIYDCIFTYVAGTVTVASNVVFGMTGTNTVNVGSGIIFENLDMAGTTTLQSDLYVAHSIGSIGTSTITLVGAYVIHFGYGGGTGNLIMYNLGTFISTTSKLSAEGTGTIFTGTSYNGMTFQPVNALQIDLDINTAGTITFNTGSNCQFGNGRTLTYVAGTVVTTGSTVYIATGGYTIDTANAFTFNVIQNTTTLNIPTALTATTMTLDSGSTTNATGNLTVGTLRMNGSATLTKPNDATILNVTTNFYQNGTDALQPSVVASPINLTDFVSSLAATMNNASSGSSFRRISHAITSNYATFTVAFDFVYAGQTASTILQGLSGGYLWLPTATTRFYYYMAPGTTDAYYFAHGMSAGQKYRVVFTKSSGSAMKCYINNVAKSAGTTGNATTLLTAYVNMNTKSSEAIGDVLFFNAEKDAAWVAADYAKFQAGGSSTAGQYDATEPDTVIGWHVDSWTNEVTGMNLKYDGTIANEQSFRGDFRYVDASTSAVPIRTWFGSVINSINVFANRITDIGGGGVSVTHY